MRPQTIQRLDQLLASMPVLIGGAVLEGEIDLAEQHIGTRFDPDYREFLMRYVGELS
ncbi:MAG TPA: hypothetical protein VK436_14335 [Methanocella sp.]|nr:hypothetical protein [Methanocella sp.]